ncbi:D-inositol 3-phosphate glycosyltransferase [Abditibacteriota bacterium]|nr:D-inositol 3-phosphate glycosyltransferase [Abditibacteriota bacterium]
MNEATLERARKPLHLCYVLPPVERYSPQIGGAIATFTMQQARRLAARGHKISVVSPHEGESVYDVGNFYPLRGVTRDSLSPLQRAVSTRVRRRFARFEWLYQEHYFAALKRTLPKIKPDAVLCFNDWQTPLFIGQLLPEARVFLRLSNECRTQFPDVNRTIERCETIWALSGYIRDWTSEHFPASKPKLQVLANGADLDSFSPTADSFTRIEQPDSPLKCLFLSRLDPNKGPDLAADAVLALRDKGLNLSLDIAGNIWFDKGQQTPPLALELKDKAERTGGHWLGHVERGEVPELVRAHDVLLLPIRKPDPMTQVVFEAMASGLAVISCALGGVPEACGDAALWATPCNAHSVADQLERLYEDREFLTQIKRRSLERAKEMTWDRNARLFATQLEGGTVASAQK